MLNAEPRKTNQQESLIEALGEWLLQRRVTERWAILLGATFVASLLDFGTYQHQLSMAGLYLAPITIACWTLSTRQAVLFTVSVAIIAGLRYPLLTPDPDFWSGINNNVGRLISFGVNAAVVMGLKSSHDRLTFFATHDPLTGVFNRKAFEDQLRLLLSARLRWRKPLMLAYVDLDGFKAINDRNGHAAGDEVLKAFAVAAKSSLSQTDIVGRLGGDEFSLAAPVTDHAAAIRLAQDLHAKLTASLASTFYPVGCSMGALFIDAGDDRSAEQLIIAGDNLMYGAKHDGKGKVQLSMSPHIARPQSGQDIANALEKKIVIQR
ncbi:GGDEF domain-containing protein [Rhizobium wenxiniae]|uniref:GGDEF domain-containing protein n=1 Tax=Rhizobium wenxiniae TaxID=1737357 RepID=UPI003C1B0645